MAANDYGKRNDWIELYNTTDHDIDLDGMYLTDDLTNLQKYQITSNVLEASTIIPAHGYRIVWADKVDPLRQLHASFKLANGNDESVTITSADLTWSNTLTYTTMNGDESVGRYPDGGKRTYRMTRPTIDAKNTLTSYSEWLYGIDENFDEDTFLTGIASVPSSDETGEDAGTAIYNLAGQRLSKPVHGINIIGGKKVLVK